MNVGIWRMVRKLLRSMQVNAGGKFWVWEPRIGETDDMLIQPDWDIDLRWGEGIESSNRRN